MLESELDKLKEENTSLQNQLHRSLKELKAYQIKYPSPFLENIHQNDDDEDQLQLPASARFMKPLFQAYDAGK